MPNTDYKNLHPLKFIRIMAYAHMRRRVEGRSTKNNHLWYDLPLCSRKTFYQFFNENKFKIKTIVKNHQRNKSHGFALSIHRLNPAEGYYPYNMKFITQSENSRLAGLKHKTKGI